jgi:POT family proton-dependent oligopeptide transporter
LDHGISMGRILSVFALIPVFWALFDQSNSTWVLQGNKMVPVTLTGFWKDAFGWFFGDAINAENMQSTNPALVMILVPFLTLGVYQWLGRHVTPLRRMGCGMFIAAFSYVIVAWLQQRIEAGEQISVAWQAVPYVFLTTGEVLISATGLEFAFTQAAPEMKSTIMSFWLLTVAAGNALVSLITSVLSSEAGGHSGAVSSGRFLLYAGMTAVVGVLFVFIAMRYRYRDTAPASPPAAS